MDSQEFEAVVAGVDQTIQHIRESQDRNAKLESQMERCGMAALDLGETIKECDPAEYDPDEMIEELKSLRTMLHEMEHHVIRQISLTRSTVASQQELCGHLLDTLPRVRSLLEEQQQTIIDLKRGNC